MIPVARVQQPADFHRRCTQPGRAWLRGHPGAKRPRDYWSPFKPILADGFDNRCGYTAMFEPVGSIDHFKSWDNHPRRAYDWNNLRFASEWVNKSKLTADDAVLDPYAVGAGWFEISLPDLQLRVTTRVPPAQRARANYTLTRLHLRDDERVLRQRRQWYAMYTAGKLSLDGLTDVAPLIAEAVRRSARAAKQPARRPGPTTVKQQRPAPAKKKRKKRRPAPRPPGRRGGRKR